MGANIGTTVTAYIASITAGANSKGAARAHLISNLLGVAWMATVFTPMLGLIDVIVPRSITDPNQIAGHLAMFHTVFNVTSKLLFFRFVPVLERTHEEITALLVECSREQISEHTTTNLNSMVQVAAQLESIADISNKLIRLAEQRIEKKINAYQKRYKKGHPEAAPHRLPGEVGTLLSGSAAPYRAHR